jgi:hypothetical protein
VNRKQPSTALVPAPDEGQLGPAMQRLPSNMMRSFVIALVTTGCSPARAAELAGYSPRIASNGQSAASMKAWQLLHDDRVQAALLEEGHKAIRGSGVAAISILEAIMRKTDEAARDRIAAAKELLARGGFAAITESHVTVTHRDEHEIDAELLALASELGMDDAAKARLIGRPVVRRESEQVTDAVVIENKPVTTKKSQSVIDAEKLLWPSPEPLGQESGVETDEDPTLGDDQC